MEKKASSIKRITTVWREQLNLEKVFEQMKAEGFDCSEKMMRKQSTLISEHINFAGKYNFRYEKELSNGLLRH